MEYKWYLDAGGYLWLTTGLAEPAYNWTFLTSTDSTNDKKSTDILSMCYPKFVDAIKLREEGYLIALHDSIGSIYLFDEEQWA